MKKRISALVLSMIMAVSAAGCGNSDKTEKDSAAETTTAASKTTVTAKPAETKKKDETTSKKKKKTETEKSESGTDEAKETTKKTTKKTEKKTEKKSEVSSVSITLPDAAQPNEDLTLGWSEELFNRYKSSPSAEDFLLSLSFDEFLIVTKLPEDEAREQYELMHNIDEQNKAPEVELTPDIKVDRSIPSDLTKVYRKFNVDLNYLCSITGLTEDEFLYLWNNVGDREFKKNVTNQLFGRNNYSDSDRTNNPQPNTISMKLLRAYWDDSAALHIICSIKSGYPGVTFNVNIPKIEVINRGDACIARKEFGWLTPYVEVDSDSETDILGLTYDTEVLHEFVFDKAHVLKEYADIRPGSGVTISYQYTCTSYDPTAEE